MNPKVARRQAKQVAAWSEVLSADESTRSIELALLRRVLVHSGLGSGKAFAKARATLTDEAHLAVYEGIRSPVYADMAREMEKSVPADADFGPFRVRK
jgi:hypothetical protein